jgi:DNA-binding SARP family transcriptional activator
MSALETAVNLYRGHLLEGWYQDWCLYDRERLENMYLAILCKIVAYCEANREYEKGVSYATKILHVDRAHEVAHQQLMRLRHLQGDRAGALRQYDTCTTALKDELGVQPSEHTRALYQRIRQDCALNVAIGPRSNGREPRQESSHLRGTLDRLVEVKTALTALQSVVEEGLLRVQQALQSSDHGSGD